MAFFGTKNTKSPKEEASEKTKGLLKKIRRIEVRTRRVVKEAFSGSYHSTFRGRGMEFDEHKEYTFGDDVRAIDWNVTARMDQAFIRRYREERELTVWILHDASLSNDFGSSGVLKADASAEVAALLAFSATANNDKVGLLLFTDRMEKIIPPRKGREHILRLIREVLMFRPANRGTRIDEALATLQQFQKKRSVVFIISDMMSEDFKKPLRSVVERHDVTAIKITDPGEMSLPSIGLLEMQDAETGERALIDTRDGRYMDDFRARTAKNTKEIERDFKKVGADFINLVTQEDYLGHLATFFRAKARRKLMGN